MECIYSTQAVCLFYRLKVFTLGNCYVYIYVHVVFLLKGFLLELLELLYLPWSRSCGSFMIIALETPHKLKL